MNSYLNNTYYCALYSNSITAPHSGSSRYYRRNGGCHLQMSVVEIVCLGQVSSPSKFNKLHFMVRTAVSEHRVPFHYPVKQGA